MNPLLAFLLGVAVGIVGFALVAYVLMLRTFFR